MPNTMRWRYGDTNPVMLAVDAGTVIEIGDLVYQETDDARPAGALADLGSEALNQEGLHDKFVGVAMQASPAGEAGQVRVATSGVFEFDCASGTFEVGALIGARENTAGNALLNQTVKSAAALSSALGRCARRVNPSGTRVLVQIESTVMSGGPQAAA
ncbi:hypothetical protein Pla175_02980 [Pirellulimonas nuda]|uniref:Uncharacterized protein n=1 Tax=Pirellulimonas nuda TaxID=2528009 RepID=A0A518D647_9BACT|nr:hypothetical protein [Pirellulimonas nuda]QDU86944.1 hypothetical protein Pla175_02980 [Pirellulimonas nuda]